MYLRCGSCPQFVALPGEAKFIAQFLSPYPLPTTTAPTTTAMLPSFCSEFPIYAPRHWNTTQIKKLQPAPAGGAGTSSRKKSGGGAGGRKSALKKSKGAGGTRAVKSDARKTKRAVGMVSSAVGNAYRKAMSAGEFAWGARNLVFFVSAVAAMHFHGDYLAV